MSQAVIESTNQLALSFLFNAMAKYKGQESQLSDKLDAADTRFLTAQVFKCEAEATKQFLRDKLAEMRAEGDDTPQTAFDLSVSSDLDHDIIAAAEIMAHVMQEDENMRPIDLRQCLPTTIDNNMLRQVSELLVTQDAPHLAKATNLKATIRSV